MRRTGWALAGLAAIAFLTMILATAAFAANEKPTVNLAGTWKLDPARSDNPQQMGGPGRGGPPGGGPDGGGHGPGGPPPRNGGPPPAEGAVGGPGGPPPDGDGKGGHHHGMMRLPDLFTLIQSPGGVEFRDSTGVAVRRILTQATGEVAPFDSAGVAQLAGAWTAARLEAQAKGSRGGTVTETYEIIDNGAALRVVTHMQPPDDRPGFDIKTVYTKVGG